MLGAHLVFPYLCVLCGVDCQPARRGLCSDENISIPVSIVSAAAACWIPDADSTVFSTGGKLIEAARAPACCCHLSLVVADAHRWQTRVIYLHRMKSSP
jgi:hypothetical protein